VALVLNHEVEWAGPTSLISGKPQMALLTA
jgi:hypothetical protein